MAMEEPQVWVSHMHARKRQKIWYEIRSLLPTRTN